MKSSTVFLGAAALSLIVVPFGTAAAAGEKPGSAYVQCDGMPDNVTDGETAARLIGAVTLLGLFAPPHESADASKRKFGADGIAACTSLLAGERPESNAKRRLGLILGRAAHRIEAKDFDGAIADVAMARREAEAAGLMADPYFSRSRGRAFDLLESAALMRAGRVGDAQAASLRHVANEQYSLFPLVLTPTYADLLRTSSDAEDRVSAWSARLVPGLAGLRADRMDINGRFAESARLRDALVEFDSEQTPETNSSSLLAEAAIAHALAGNFELASERSQAARANAEKRRQAGQPEKDAAAVVELLDFYTIIDTARSGDLKTARRLFGGRSEWVNASLGSVMEVNKRLREGASPDELAGPLSHTPDELWNARAETRRAEMIARDSDNKSLFAMIPGERAAKLYQAVARDVWRTEKSKIILKTKMDAAKARMELMYLPTVDPLVAMDAYVLHAALTARSRGHQGFVFSPIVSDKIIAGSFRTGNRGDKGFPADLFLDADDVIAKLSPVIPEPAKR
jgi:hypothetical protein